LAGEHLLSLGRSKFAFIGNASEHSPEFFERYQGFVQAISTNGIEPAQVPQLDAISTEQAGFDATLKLLASGYRPDAIFAASDLIAIGVMRALQQQSFHVPRDVAVVGFDDIPVASFSSPALTTIQQNTTLAGEMLVVNLLRLINQEGIAQTEIEPKIIVRRSCGAEQPTS
jgi:DNA-binding LacI/PurR family transcriptional regulator